VAIAVNALTGAHFRGPALVSTVLQRGRT